MGFMISAENDSRQSAYFFLKKSTFQYNERKGASAFPAPPILLFDLFDGKRPCCCMKGNVFLLP